MSNSAHIKPNMKWAYIEGTLRQIAEVQLWPKAFQSSRQKPSESESVEPSALCAISSQLWRKSPDRHGFCVISSVTCRSRKFSDTSLLMTCQKVGRQFARDFATEHGAASCWTEEEGLVPRVVRCDVVLVFICFL